MVTGGYDGSSRLDSTEIFSDNVWRTIPAKLSAPMFGLGVVTINNRVLAFGNPLLFVTFIKLIYDGFLQVGTMKVLERKFPTKRLNQGL